MTGYQCDWVSRLTEKLFEAELNHFQREIDKLIEENDKLLGQYNNCFNFMGRNYGLRGTPVASAPNLVQQLVPRMLQLNELWKSIELDYRWITQIFTNLIRGCTTAHEVRNAFPECVVTLDPLLMAYQRTKEAGWTLQDNPRHLRQYLKILSKIETYCAMRFLY